MKRWILPLTAVFVLVACSLFTSLDGRDTPTPAQLLPTTSLPVGTLTGTTAEPSPTPTAIPPSATPGERPPSQTPEPTKTSKPAVLTATSPSPDSLLVMEAIHMIDPDQGWAIGGTSEEPAVRVLRTSDGGKTFWDVSPQLPLPESPDTALHTTAFFWDLDLGWVLYTASGPTQPIAAPPVIWFTRNGGQRWTPAGALPLNGDEGYLDRPILTFSDPSNGWLLVHVDAGMSHDYVELFRTSDGGATWNLVMDPFSPDSPQACAKTGLVFQDPNLGWLTKDCGGVIDGVSLDTSTDGGQTWREQQLPPPENDLTFFGSHVCGAYDPFLFSSQVGALVVRCARMADFDQHDDYLYLTSDGGLTWQTQPYPGGQLFLLDPQVGWALSRQIFKTSDGGLTWQQIMTTRWDGQFSFVDALHGWAVARATNDAGEQISALVQTVNGGGRWIMLEPVLVSP